MNDTDKYIWNRSTDLLMQRLSYLEGKVVSEVSCENNDCDYNKNGHCIAKQVHLRVDVYGKTVCDTFKDTML